AGPRRGAAVLREGGRARYGARPVLARAARVDHHRTVSEQRIQQVLRQSRRAAEAAQQRRAVTVDALHLREVLRRLRLTRKDHLHELGFALRCEAQVEQLLVTQRALRYRTERLAACTARTMPRP